MKLTSLSLLISSALLSQSALAGTTNLVELGEQAKAQLNHMRQLATDATNVVEREGQRFLQYQGK